MKTLSLSDATREAVMLALDTRIQMCAKYETETRKLADPDALERHAHWLGEGQKTRAAFIEFMKADRA